MSYKWSWDRAGRVVKTITANKAVISLIVANVLTILVGLGFFRSSDSQIQNMSVELVGTILATVNAIALLIGGILEARREPKESNTN